MTIMTNRDEIHDIGDGKQRMNLHCWYPMKKDSNGYYEGKNHSSHFGVIVNSPNPWKCLEYNFSFRHQKKNYKVSGRDTSYHYNGRIFTGGNTSLKEDWLDDNIVSVPFISLSTDNDMHEDFWKLFNKLDKLVIFS